MDNSSLKSGFTLIELSIVLVIIGLIVGGILVGRDMIAAAEIRGTISQFEKLTTAANTFRTKYKYLPGDLPAYLATRLGFFAIAGGNANLQGFGDGNGILEGGNVGGRQGPMGELNIYYRHLSDASLIEGSYGTTGNGALTTGSGFVTVNLVAGTMYQLYVPAKIGGGCYLRVGFTAPALNYYEIQTYTSVDTAGGSSGTTCISPMIASQLDAKMDDGMPLTGNFTSGIVGGCVTVANIYDVTTANADTPNCFAVKRTVP